MKIPGRHALYWQAFAREFDKVQDYNLFDCIECGCCVYVCPSRIPLVQYYRHAKSDIWEQERERKKSDIARQRHEARLERLEKQKQERETRLKKKREALAKNKKGRDKEMDKKKAHTALVELDGVISPTGGVNADTIVEGLRDAFDVRLGTEERQ